MRLARTVRLGDPDDVQPGPLTVLNTIPVGDDLPGLLARVKEWLP